MSETDVKSADEPYVANGTYRSLKTRFFLQAQIVLAALLAWFTGKPDKHQEPLLRLSGLQLFAISLATLFASSYAAGWLIHNFSGYPWVWPSIAFLVLVNVGRLRALGVVFAHHASHGAVSPQRWVNRSVAGIASAIALVESPADYKAAHVQKHHRSAIFTTEEDPDAQFLLTMGFRPGMTKSQLWWQLAWSVVSVKFHATFLEERLKSSLLRSEGGFRIFAVMWMATIVMLGLILPLHVWLIVVVLPMTFLYQISALLQFVSEHPWLAEARAPQSTEQYMDRCWARFCGDPLPSARGLSCESIGAWAIWIVRLVMHAVVRISVLVGDLPVHDVHHLAGHMRLNLSSWRTAIFDRQHHIDQGDQCGLGAREIWGLDKAIDRVFLGMAARTA
ncbi:fatty acid desaturase [Parvibaculaceae bacterium PLY_AMNH_Bact1]|nr:fatty acid desaturase [Parvibaculaceae bacterium PLY_AMNH_Bact1]